MQLDRVTIKTNVKYGDSKPTSVSLIFFCSESANSLQNSEFCKEFSNSEQKYIIDTKVG